MKYFIRIFSGLMMLVLTVLGFTFAGRMLSSKDDMAVFAALTGLILFVSAVGGFVGSFIEKNTKG